MQTIETIIMRKKKAVASISKEKSVLEAAGEMAARKIGSLVVTDGDKVVGIFTERDSLIRVVSKNRDPARTAVSDVMSSPIAVCRPDTSIEECKAVMTEKRLRHLPVVEGGKLVGIVTSGDILAQEVVKHEETIEYLNQYLYGPLHNS